MRKEQDKTSDYMYSYTIYTVMNNYGKNLMYCKKSLR